jgi:hypothetical protein
VVLEEVCPCGSGVAIWEGMNGWKERHSKRRGHCESEGWMNEGAL